ncbi:MAG: ABC transporter ATP-binding protein [Eubacteriales bacterium]|nr:ABC transporter ATP-binding protein [Eubacteriales bacterium]
MNDNILEIRNLRIQYKTRKGIVEAVNGIDLTIGKGETLGLVGETGAGKTTTALGILQLIPDPPGKIIEGEIFFDGTDLLKLSISDMRKIRGNSISMIFQDPMTALNPLMTVGNQIAEVIRLHDKLSAQDATVKSQQMLEKVGIPSERFNEYPHQFSGGMKQRVVIAIALACNPALLIADEPTTALDVTIQAQVLEIMNNLKNELNTSMILITHDLGIVAEICEKVAIMYAGEIIESGTAEDIFDRAKHPYTIGLFGAIPNLDEDTERLIPIAGLMPDPMALPVGCNFAVRCPRKMPECELGEIPTVHFSESHYIKCLLFKDMEQEVI